MGLATLVAAAQLIRPAASRNANNFIYHRHQCSKAQLEPKLTNRKWVGREEGPTKYIDGVRDE